MSDRMRELVDYWLALWCRCICRESPDGTMCDLCGHAHKPKPHIFEPVPPATITGCCRGCGGSVSAPWHRKERRVQ